MQHALVGKRDGKIDCIVPDERDPRAQEFAVQCIQRGGEIYRVPYPNFKAMPTYRCGTKWPWGRGKRWKGPENVTDKYAEQSEVARKALEGK